MMKIFPQLQCRLFDRAKLPSIIAASVLAGLLSLSSGCGEQSEKSEKAVRPPLILLFSIDTLRADHLSCYGYPRPTTPFIDRFASRAVLCRNAVSQGSVTAPAHMSIFTSLTPVVHRVRNPSPFDESIIPLAESIPTWPALLHERGWMTYGLHGGGPVSAQFGFARGFDSYRDDFFYAFQVDYYRPERELATIREIIRSGLKQDRPVFLFLHHYICHDPYLKAPPEFNRRFLEKPVSGLPLSRADLKTAEDGAIDEESFWDGFDLNNPDHLNHLVALYDGSILYADWIFQKVIEILHDENVYENSLIVLTSDHGEEFNEHGGYRHWKLFAEILNVPLIIKFPGGVFAGRTVSEHVRAIDIFPTVFDYLGFGADHPIQGASFLPLLTGKGGYDPLIYSQALDLNSPEQTESVESVRVLKNGLAYSNQWIAGENERLFNLGGDPREQANMMETSPREAGVMRGVAGETLGTDRSLRDNLGAGPGGTEAPDKSLSRQFKALGYIQ